MITPRHSASFLPYLLNKSLHSSSPLTWLKSNNRKVCILVFYVFFLLSCSEDTVSSFNNQVAGIDMSHHQKNVNWEKLSSNFADSTFLYVKATEGATYKDPKCLEYAAEARRNGFLVGCYHFFRMTSGAVEQYRNFKSVLDKVGPDLIPMVDVEINDKRDEKILQDSLQVLLDLLERDYGKKPMIYGTNYSYNRFCAPRFNKYPTYIGRYGQEPPVMKGKGTYTIWQYTDTATIAGCEKPIDLCRFNKGKSVRDILL